VGDLAKQRIQLQKTVKEFMIAKLGRESLEAIMLDVCFKYLLLREIGTTPPLSEELLATEQLPQHTVLFEERGPFDYNRNCTWEVWEEDQIHYDPVKRGFGHFFVYASVYWLEHLGAVGDDNLPNLQDVATLCHAGSKRLDDWTKQHCLPDCTLKARFDFPSHLYDPLSITALYGTYAMLIHLLNTTDLSSHTYLPLSVMEVSDQVLQYGNLAKLRLVFLHHRNRQEVWRSDFFLLVVDSWSDTSIRGCHEDWEVTFSLVDGVLNVLAEEG
jgi:hypothetical protein